MQMLQPAHLHHSSQSRTLQNEAHPRLAMSPARLGVHLSMAAAAASATDVAVAAGVAVATAASGCADAAAASTPCAATAPPAGVSAHRGHALHLHIAQCAARDLALHQEEHASTAVSPGTLEAQLFGGLGGGGGGGRGGGAHRAHALHLHIPQCDCFAHHEEHWAVVLSPARPDRHASAGASRADPATHATTRSS